MIDGEKENLKIRVSVLHFSKTLFILGISKQKANTVKKVKSAVKSKYESEAS